MHGGIHPENAAACWLAPSKVPKKLKGSFPAKTASRAPERSQSRQGSCSNSFGRFEPRGEVWSESTTLIRPPRPFHPTEM